MHADNVTTPFGRRPMTLALLKGQMNAPDHGPATATDKWKVFRDICEAREILGVNDRALSVLNALISFHPNGQLSDGDNLVVFPSNAQLTLRAHGITGTTLRRHLAALIEAGLIHRKDSPNGKRYAHRNAKGMVDRAFGFSLRPLLLRAAEFARLAERVIADRKAMRLAKEHLSICRRDIRKLLSAAMTECVSGDWCAFSEELDGILAALSKKPTIQEIAAATEACDRIRVEVINQLETQLNLEITATSDVQNERHLQNTKPYTNIESEPTSPTRKLPVNHQSRGKGSDQLSLSLVLKTCPQIIDYAPNGTVTGWDDLLRAAMVVRMMLGITEPVYSTACGAMGPQKTAAVVAYILERGGLIKSAGGYLRDLTRRAEAGALQLEPMLQALLRAKAAGMTQP